MEYNEKVGKDCKWNQISNGNASTWIAVLQKLIN
jgi:hypothetical protein